MLSRKQAAYCSNGSYAISLEDIGRAALADCVASEQKRFGVSGAELYNPDLKFHQIIKSGQIAAIPLVVLFHSYIVVHDEGITYWKYYYLNYYLGPMLMPLFFCAAGMSMSRVLKMRSLAFAKSRLASYIWIYIIWSLILGLIELVASGGEYKGALYTLADIVLMLIRPTGVLWFLHHLIIFIAATKVVSGKSGATVLGVILFFYCVEYYFYTFYLDRFLLNFWFFMLGYYFKCNIEQILLKTRMNTVYGLFAIYSLWVVAASNVHALSFPMIACPFGFIGFVWFSRIADRLLGARFLHKTMIGSDDVFAIYLVHMPFVIALSRVAVFSKGFVSIVVLKLMSPLCVAFGALILAAVTANWLKRLPWLFYPPRWFARICSDVLGRILHQLRVTVRFLVRMARIRMGTLEPGAL